MAAHIANHPAEPQQLGWEECDLSYIHTCDGKVNSLASKFVLRAQPLSAEIKISPRAPNCTLNDFYILTLPLAMGSDAVP